MGATAEDEIYVHSGAAPKNAVDKLRMLAEERKPILIIIDTLFRLIRVKDANDYATMTLALEPLMETARGCGAHLLVTHHGGKADREGMDSILGSTAIFGAVDTAILIKRGRNTERSRAINGMERT